MTIDSSKQQIVSIYLNFTFSMLNFPLAVHCTFVQLLVLFMVLFSFSQFFSFQKKIAGRKITLWPTTAISTLSCNLSFLLWSTCHFLKLAILRDAQTHTHTHIRQPTKQTNKQATSKEREKNNDHIIILDVFFLFLIQRKALFVSSHSGKLNMWIYNLLIPFLLSV